MKLVFILFLIVLFSGFFIGTSYSQHFNSLIHWHQTANLNRIELLDDFDNYHFSLGEHIEEKEPIYDDEVIRKYLLNERSSA